MSRFDKVVVFDLDDTLYLERDYVESGLRAVGHWARSQLGTDRLTEIMISFFRGGQRTRLFDTALDALGVGSSPMLIGRMLQVYRQHRPRITIAPDSAAFLAEQSPGCGFAVITDGFRDAQKRKVAALDLHRRGIAIAICTDRWGRDAWKPGRRGFDYVAAHFALPPDAFCYVGDNPEKDFQAPRALGWRTIEMARPERLTLRRTPSACRADRRIRSFDEW